MVYITELMARILVYHSSYGLGSVQDNNNTPLLASEVKLVYSQCRLITMFYSLMAVRIWSVPAFGVTLSVSLIQNAGPDCLEAGATGAWHGSHPSRQVIAS